MFHRAQENASPHQELLLGLFGERSGSGPFGCGLILSTVKVAACVNPERNWKASLTPTVRLIRAFSLKPFSL
jgi:hypothetical protein